MKKLYANFIYLGLLQGANYLLPLITLPYLITVIGISKIGLIAFVGAFIAYLQIFTDYGFNLSATRKIAIHSDDKNKINEIYSATLSIQVLLTLLGAIILLFLMLCIPIVQEHYLMYLFTFIMVIGQTLFPSWYFQGIQEMKYITILNVIAKLFFTIAIFAVIKKESDYVFVPLLTSCGYLIAGIGSLFIIHKKFNVSFLPQPISKLKLYIKDGWHIFASSFFGSLYRNTNVVIIGLLTNNLFVGYYAVAEKIFKAVQSLQNVVGTTLFPFLSGAYDKSKTAFFSFIDKKLKFIAMLYCFAAILIFLSADFIVALINKESNWNIVTNLKLLSIVIIIGGLNYVLGILGLVALDHKKAFFKYILITGVFNVFLCSILVHYYKDIGASFSLIASELLLLVLIGIKTRKIYKAMH